MTSDIRHRIHRRGDPLNTTFETATLSATTLFFALLSVIFLCLGVLVFRAG